MRTRFVSFFTLLRQRPHFRRLWLASVISMLGDWLSYVAVSVVALKHGGGALAVGLVMMSHTLPVALVSPIAGPLADRVDRRTLMVVADLGAAALTFAMWLAAHNQAVGWLQVFLLLRVAISSLNLTACSAALPTLVEKEELATANAFNGLTWSLLFAGGTALGGLLAAWLGAGEAILLDALSFVVSAIVVLGLPRLRPPPPETAPPRPGLRDLAAAWHFARPRPQLLASLLAKTPVALLTAAGWVSINILAQGRHTALGLSSVAAALGLMHAVRAIGTGVGPLIPRHWLPFESNISGPLTFIGISTFLVFDSPALFLPGLFLWGVGTGHNWVASTVAIQVGTPGHLLGRMSGLDMMCMTLGQATLAVAAGLAIDWTGVGSAGGWLGLGLGVAGWVPLMVLQRRKAVVT